MKSQTDWHAPRPRYPVVDVCGEARRASAYTWPPAVDARQVLAAVLAEQ